MRKYKRYFYGLWITETGKNCVFVCTSREKIPTTASHIKSRFAFSEMVYDLANTMKKEADMFQFQAGDVVIYADRYGHHTAIVLEKRLKNSVFLFVTSNPNWNQYSRKISIDEEALLGYPNRGKQSYFAPVIRPNDYVIETGKSYPLYRVKELLLEFDDGCQ